MRLSCLFLLLTALPCFASVKITTTNLPGDALGTPYNASVLASGGCTPYHNWTVASGALPPGISAQPSSDTRSDVLSGTPLIAGSYSFAISVQGCGGHVSTQSYTIAISSVSIPHNVSLNWGASSTPGVNYHVYRTTVSGGYYALLGSAAATAYIDSSVVAGLTYFYVASAFNANGESSYSNEVPAIIPNP